MSSSTSSSEHEAARRAKEQAAPWLGFVRTFAITAASLLFGTLALAFLLDPYDTGRTPLEFSVGVRPQAPRTAAASRGRDPAFTSAIFGNSHIQLISPERLTRATGIPFVSLIAPGSRPKEAIVLIDWFLRHHRGTAEALVIGIDDYWCVSDPALPDALPFPYWLYTDSLRDYLIGLIRFDVVEELQRRLAFILARKPERARPDGYWDYEPNYASQGYDADPAIRAKLDGTREALTRNPTGRYPAADRLEARLAATAADLPVILVRPPVYRTALPAPGSADAASETACRDAFAALAARRPRTALIDWRHDRPELRDPNQFFDHSHYRQPIARLVEADIAATLAAMR
jgi:hypothetical protein